MQKKEILELIAANIRAVPDFPKAGILFRDITPLFLNPAAYNACLDEMIERVKDLEFDSIAGLESRGFLLGFALAARLNKPFIVIRKKGKLPGKTVGCSYSLEYGKAEIEVPADSIAKGSRVLIHDDLLATGGTAGAAAHLVTECGASVAGFLFLIELADLKGSSVIEKHSKSIVSILSYSGL